MIVSRTHKFIFLKSVKTAGTSIQVALSPFLVPGVDCGCGARWCSTKCPFVGGNCYQLLNPKKTPPTREQLPGHYRRTQFFSPHESLKSLVATLPQDEIKQYFKFVFVRNPFDRLVSRYWHLGGPKKYDSFNQFVLKYPCLPGNFIYRTWCRYNEIKVDFIGRYENLKTDFNYICDTIGLPRTELPRCRGQHRKDKKHYTEYYTKELRELVESYCAEDLKQFNYKFGD